MKHYVGLAGESLLPVSYTLYFTVLSHIKCMYLSGENSFFIVRTRNRDQTMSVSVSGFCGNSQTLVRTVRSGELLVVKLCTM